MIYPRWSVGTLILMWWCQMRPHGQWHNQCYFPTHMMFVSTNQLAPSSLGPQQHASSKPSPKWINLLMHEKQNK